MSIVARHKKLAFYGVPTTGGSSAVTYHRMKGFTSLGQSKNPNEYSRKYVDEPISESDIVGYSPSIGYTFDLHTGNAVHSDIALIADGELIGDDAVRSIILVDVETKKAYKRDFAVIPSSEGDNANVYTYSGNFKCKGVSVSGTAASADDWQTVTFEADSSD